ncbi:MAG: hypothetical protein ACXWUL_10165, partial [Caldimonas sp.]
AGGSRVLGSAGVDLAAVAFSPDGKWLVAGGDRGVFKAFPVEAKSVPPTFAGGARGTVDAVAFDRSGRRLFTASRAGRIEVFDTATGQLAQAIDVLEHGALENMAVSPDGHFVVTGHATGLVVLWHRASGTDAQWPFRILLRHAAPVRGLAFAGDGRRVLSAGADGRLFVTLPVDRGRWTRVDRPAPVASAPDRSISPDGRWIAKATGPGNPDDPYRIDLGALSRIETARLSVLHAADRAPVVENAELPVEPGEKAGRPVFSADSKTIALDVSGKLVLWDMATLRAFDTSIALPPGSTLAAAQPGTDGWLATSREAHYAFDANPETLREIVCRLAGGPLSLERWKRYLGDNRPYATACR